MFRKLRFKLTLINVSIILTLFLILIIGSYSFSQYEMNRHAELMAKRIIMDVKAALTGRDWPPGNHGLPGPPPGFPPGPPPGFRLSLSPDHLAALTEAVLQTDNQQGTMIFGTAKYFYRKEPLTEPAGTIVLLHDLTSETHLQLALLTALIVVGAICSLLSFGASFFMANRAMIPIQEAWQQQNDFLSDASHELRTPLAVIQTNLDIVRKEEAETAAGPSKWLDNIQDETIYMAKLVNSLLFLARADSHQQPLAKQFFSLAEALKRVVDHFAVLAAAKEIGLKLAAEDHIEIWGDELRIQQVVGILLDNAIRHTPAGGAVVVSLYRSGARALLAVTDSGEGIEPEYLTKIFNRFYQVDKSRTSGGAGLGLAIAKWIVESHGGIIRATSTPGVKTTFEVSLPLTVRT